MIKFYKTPLGLFRSTSKPNVLLAANVPFTRLVFDDHKKRRHWAAEHLYINKDHVSEWRPLSGFVRPENVRECEAEPVKVDLNDGEIC